MYNWLMLLVAFFLVALNALFVAAEFGFVKVMRVRIELLAENGSSRAKQALYGITHLDAYLSVCQLGITLASLGLGWIGEPAVSNIISPLLSLLGIDEPVLVHTISLILGFSFITFLHVIFGELAPKTLSIQRAETIVLLLAHVMRFFYTVFLPFVKILNGTSNAFLRLFGFGQNSDSEHSHTSEELQLLIMDSQKSGHIDEQEQRLLSNVFLFDRRTAADAMVHRMDTVTLSVDDVVQSVMLKIKETGHTRFPVYKDDNENIVGFINIKDLLGANPQTAIKTFVRKPFFIFESMALDNLLLKMQKHRQQFGIVLDEYGGWQGIITMEDMLEIIVGDLKDEHDLKDLWGDDGRIADENGIVRVLASTSVEDLFEFLHLPLSDLPDDYNTVAGLFMEKFGLIPEVGDSIIFENFKFTVIAMDGKRVKALELVPLYN